MTVIFSGLSEDNSDFTCSPASSGEDAVEEDGVPAGRGVWGKCSVHGIKTFLKRSLCVCLVSNPRSDSLFCPQAVSKVRLIDDPSYAMTYLTTAKHLPLFVSLLSGNSVNPFVI